MRRGGDGTGSATGGGDVTNSVASDCRRGGRSPAGVGRQGLVGYEVSVRHGSRV